MKTLSMSKIAAHYVETSAGPLRLWRAGAGPSLLVLPGLLRSTRAVARMLTETCPGWAITVIELPGIGGSARIESRSAARVAAVIEEAVALLHIDVAAVLAYDLSAPIAQLIATRHPTARLLLVDTESARQWAARKVSPPSLALRADGTHLAALWTHVRDCGMLDPVSPTRVSKSGSPLADVADLDAAVVAASVKPEAYAALWACCAAAFDQSADGDGRISLGNEVESADVEALLARWLSEVPAASATAGAPTPPDAVVAPDAKTVRYSYLQLPSGRVHVRRTGSSSESGSRTLLMFHSAPGSAEPLEALMQGLAHGREVIACDYLGNGDSDKAAVGIDADIATDIATDIDIATLARHGREVADALGLAQVDLFGTHTGAMIAMEFAIHWPDRVGRMILEAPVLIDPAFAADILAHYLPPLVPDRWGTHLLRAWNMRRDMFLFWPWYRQAREAHARSARRRLMCCTTGPWDS